MITEEQQKDVFKLVYQVRSYRFYEKRAVAQKRYRDADAAYYHAEILKESLLDLIDELTAVDFDGETFRP